MAILGVYDLEDRLELVFSDVHQPEAARTVYRLAHELKRERPKRYVRGILNGDDTAHPHEDPLRAVKKAAREAQARGEPVDFIKEEEKEWADPAKSRELADIYRPGYENSLEIVRILGNLVTRGLINERILKLEGNDADRIRRIMKAEYRHANAEGVSPRANLAEVINASPMYRQVVQVEFDLFGRALHIRIPYVEDKGPEVLDSYLNHISRGLKSDVVQRSGIEQAIIMSHTNADPTFRLEENNSFYLKVYDLIRQHLPQVFQEGRVAQISGHTHFTPDEYMFEGVRQFAIGFGDSRGQIPEEGLAHYRIGKQPHIQRTLVYNPFNPLGTIMKADMPLPLRL